jgi:hypothetical protein
MAEQGLTLPEIIAGLAKEVGAPHWAVQELAYWIATHDIRSVWVRRPDPQASHSLGFLGISADASVFRDGTVVWAIRSGDQVLGRDGQFIIEPLPSSRDAEFYQQYRFATLEEALAFARALGLAHSVALIPAEDRG